MSNKRKKNFYAVARGIQTGIYTRWDEVAPLVLGHTGSVYKGFATRPEAEAWLAAGGHHKPTVPTPPHVKLKKSRAVVHVDTQPAAAAGAESVWCDGACPFNGTKEARAGIGVYFGPDDARNLSVRLDPAHYRQTNQVAEIVAAIHAVQRADPARPLAVFTDSIYVVKAMMQWRQRWKAKQWQGVKLTNHDLLRCLSDLVDQRQPKPGVVFHHVRGHGTNVGNIEADRLATQGADS